MRVVFADWKVSEVSGMVWIVLNYLNLHITPSISRIVHLCFFSVGDEVLSKYVRDLRGCPPCIEAGITSILAFAMFYSTTEV